MSKWKVSANMLPVEFEVEADDEEEAIEQAQEMWKEQASEVEWTATEEQE